MTTAVVQVDAPRTGSPTIWGCTPQQTHDRFWAAFGVQVVRWHHRSEIVEGAELFLLCESDYLVLFRLSQVIDTLYWLNPRLLMLRVRDERSRSYREIAVTESDRLVRFERAYRSAGRGATRVALTWDREIARMWQNGQDASSPWRWLKSQVERKDRVVRPATARVYDSGDDTQLMECFFDMMRYWKSPDTTIRRARRLRDEAVVDATSHVDDGAVLLGPVWVGAGRTIESGTHVVGPAVLWDDPESRPAPDEVKWLEIEPASLASDTIRRGRPGAVPGKRAFDVALSLVALTLTLPLLPVVAVAILVEDGRPIFFAHRRETVGGREFPCLKFRSMKKSADETKEDLALSNEADGPQFFIHDDPRVTRVGRIIRKLQIDELPQLVNVLLGHMSIVGPRPSPYSENQFCPPWREARLSVRPGMTGLWQVSRTRKQGLDFQEWIRFDMEYVEHASWGLDLKIIWRTLRVVLAGLVK